MIFDDNLMIINDNNRYVPFPVVNDFKGFPELDTYCVGAYRIISNIQILDYNVVVD